MRIFLFVNLLFIIFLTAPENSSAGKSEQPKSSDTTEKWDPLFGVDFQKALYRTTLDISKHHLTGFIFIKKVSDTSYRILFSNEMGMNFFDLEFLNEEFIVHYCFPSLDRKSLLKLLDNDFRILFFPNHGIKTITREKTENRDYLSFKVKAKSGKWIYRISVESRKILSIRSVGKFLSRTRIDLGHSVDLVTGINISNPVIKLTISMNMISQ